MKLHNMLIRESHQNEYKSIPIQFDCVSIRYWSFFVVVAKNVAKTTDVNDDEEKMFTTKYRMEWMEIVLLNALTLATWMVSWITTKCNFTVFSPFTLQHTLHETSTCAFETVIVFLALSSLFIADVYVCFCLSFFCPFNAYMNGKHTTTYTWMDVCAHCDSDDRDRRWCCSYRTFCASVNLNSTQPLWWIYQWMSTGYSTHSKMSVVNEAILVVFLCMLE